MIDQVEKGHSHEQDTHIFPPRCIVRVIQEVKDQGLTMQGIKDHQIIHVEKTTEE